jgi:hypothetical protein
MPAGVSAYTALANVTLGSSAATVTFSSIPATYRDLVLVATCQSAVSGNSLILRINSDASNYSLVGARGNGSNTLSTTSTTFYGFFTDFMSTTAPDLLMTANFMDYSATDKHKTVLLRGNRPTIATEMSAVRWANTAAITSIQFRGDSGNLAAGSTFALYGVSA